MRTISSRIVGAFGLLACLAFAGPADAQEVEEQLRELRERVEELGRRVAAQDTAELARIRAQIEALTRQLEELQLGQDVVAQADTPLYGFAPAAAKIYRVRQGVSVGGYGEVLYENFSDEREDGSPSDATDQLDFLRGIVYIGYKFNDRFLFNSEIEYEHGSTSGGTGEVSIEFAYLDYWLGDSFGFRAGMLLSPMGFLNELHEPPIFLGTTRPLTEQRIIPSTWRENGLGIFGEARDISYRAYVLNGLDAVGDGDSPASGFSASGVRGGRQKGARALAEDFGAVGRVDYNGVPGLLIGTSAYIGNSGQGAVVGETGEEIGARTLIWEGHAEFRAYGLDLRGLFAIATLDEVDLLNQRLGLTGAGSVGERMIGWYLQAGYDILSRARTQHQLIPYLRFEQLNTQDEVPDGFAADPATDLQVISVGAAWKPLPSIIVKADYQIHSNEADTGVDQINAAIGYLF